MEVFNDLDTHILNLGNSDCEHKKIHYIDNAFDGQAFWCDDCPRHERMDYSPGRKIRFPAGSLISTPNPNYGGEKFYSHRADGNGTARLLDRKDWVLRRS